MGHDVRVAADDIDGKKGLPNNFPTVDTGAGGRHHLSVSLGHSEGGGKKSRRMRVVEEDELGRVGPFSVHSAATVLSESSFPIPSSALVASTQRRRGKGYPAIRIVLEIVQDSNGNGGGGERGSVFTRGRKTPFLKKRKLHSKCSSSNGNEDGDGRVIARAVLDAEFLQRTIACQRSVEMMRASAVPGDVGAIKQDGEPLPLVPFARLDVAGHVVSARPGQPRLRLQLLECQNLRSTDMLGKSDPCVVVFWDGAEVGRTPIARDLNPIFSAAGSTFRLPLVPPMSTTTGVDPTTPTTAENGGRRSTVNWRAYAPELRLEVWDMDRDAFSRKWKQGQLLGVVTLHGAGGIAPVVEACTAHTSGIQATPWAKPGAQATIFRLSPANRRVSKHGFAGDKHVQGPAGVISIKMAVENATDDSEAWISQASAPASTAAALVIREAEIQTATVSALDLSPSPTLQLCSPDTSADTETEFTDLLGVRCLDARGLPLGCDGYCRIFWNGRQVGNTLPASCVARSMENSARNNVSIPTSAFQRNPVWWASSSQASSTGGNGDPPTAGLKSSDAMTIVRLHENPTAEDELTLEVFDGIHMRDLPVNTPAKHRASRGDSITGTDAGDAGPNSNAVGVTPEKMNNFRRDLLGRSIGSVTVRGDYLLNPPRGRIDLPLLVPPPSSRPGSDTVGITLSISLSRLLSEKNKIDSTTCSAITPPPRSATTPGQSHRIDHVSVTPSTSTTITSSANMGEGVQTGALDEDVQNRQRPARWLRLNLQEAQLRKGLDISGTSDPFCTVYVDRVWFCETRVCWGTLAPRWDQWIQIEVIGRGRTPETELGLDGHEIRVEVWDKDLVGANDFIGEVHLFLQEKQDG